MIFYEIGVGITLFLLLYALFINVVNQKVEESEIAINVVVAISLSLLSWVLIISVITIACIDNFKNKNIKM